MRTGKILVFIIGIFEAAFLAFSLIVSILVWTNMANGADFFSIDSLHNANIERNGPFIGFFQNNTSAFFLIICLPIFVMIALDFVYFAKTAFKKETSLSEEQVKKLKEKAREEARFEILNKEKNECLKADPWHTEKKIIMGFRKAVKANMIATIIMSLFIVASASVSTFAWFQAQANVAIQASSNGTTIAVSKPDDYAFYAYRYNCDSTNYGTVVDFVTDFIPVTSGNASTLTSSSGMNPGQSMVFCLKVTSATVNSPITLTINKLVSNTADKQGLAFHRYVTVSGEDYDINVGWAMDIYTMANSTGTEYSDFLTKNKESETGALADEFDYGQTETNSIVLGELNDDGAGSAPDKVIDLDEDIEIYNDDATATTMYLFYRLYFSNLESTYYREYSDGSNYNIEVTDADRTFDYVGDNTGTSNCYGGLKFQLVTMTLEF